MRGGVTRDLNGKRAEHCTQVTTAASLLLLLLMLVNAQKSDHRSKSLKISDARSVKGNHGAVLTRVGVQNYILGWKCLSFVAIPGSVDTNTIYYLNVL